MAGSRSEAALPVGSFDQFATQLISGYWRSLGSGPHKFDTRDSNQLTVNLTGLDATGLRLARAALETWEAVANLDFREVTSGGEIRFEDTGSTAITNFRFSGATTTSATVTIGAAYVRANGAEFDSFSMATYIHEIGHALGLGHAGNYNGFASWPSGALFANDSFTMSVMSYFRQDRNPTSEASFGLAMTPMVADILAIQSMYGRPLGGASAGNTTYGDNTTLTNSLGDLFRAIQSGPDGTLYRGIPSVFAIFDEGGVDTINLSSATEAQTIRLFAESFSDVHGGVRNLSIARGTVIEIAIGGSNADVISGNSVSNRLTGNGGNDQLFGGAGNDILDGGLGNDRLTGGDGNDVFYAQDGNDALYGGLGNDRLYGQRGTDTLVGAEGADTLYGGVGNDLLYGGAGADAIIFDAGRDRVYGFQDNFDTIFVDNLLWGNTARSVGQIVAAATVTGGNTVLTFGANSLTIIGLTTPSSLSDDLAIL